MAEGRVRAAINVEAFKADIEGGIPPALGSRRSDSGFGGGGACKQRAGDEKTEQEVPER